MFGVVRVSEFTPGQNLSGSRVLRKKDGLGEIAVCVGKRDHRVFAAEEQVHGVDRDELATTSEP